MWDIQLNTCISYDTVISLLEYTQQKYTRMFIRKYKMFITELVIPKLQTPKVSYKKTEWIICDICIQIEYKKQEKWMNKLLLKQ